MGEVLFCPGCGMSYGVPTHAKECEECHSSLLSAPIVQSSSEARIAQTPRPAVDGDLRGGGLAIGDPEMTLSVELDGIVNAVRVEGPGAQDAYAAALSQEFDDERDVRWKAIALVLAVVVVACLVVLLLAV